MDLQEPTNKMATTGGTAQGTVLIADPPDVIRKKFKTAVTDSGTDVRHVDALEETLDRAVLTERAVERGEHHIDSVEATTGPDRHALATALPHPVTSNLDLHGNVP